MKPTFTPDEIAIDKIHGQNLPSKEKFETLRAIASKGEFMAEYEKDFFCSTLPFLTEKPGSWEEYKCCDDYKFMSLYLTYFRNLAGGIKYYRVPNNRIEWQNTSIGEDGFRLMQIGIPEVDSSLKYLQSKAEEWDLHLGKAGFSNSLLVEALRELKSQLKLLDKQPDFSNDPFSKGRFLYKYKRWSIILQLKYVYLIATRVFEREDLSDHTYSLNGETIEFNEHSIVHILSRHFSQVTKQFKTNKTFHNKDFIPKVLSKQLKAIIEDIDASGFLAGKDIQKIAFRLNNIDYLIWTSLEKKTLKGKGTVSYRRLNTFFPALLSEKQNELSQAQLKMISNILGVYIF